MGKKKSSRNKKHGSDSDSGSDSDDRLAIAEPFVQVIYEFCIEPKSSRVALIWNLCTCFAEVAYLLSTCVQTLDGPNHYTGRENNSKYPFLFLLDDATYKLLDRVLIAPIVLDALIKIYLVLVLKLSSSNKVLNGMFSSGVQQFEKALIYMEIVGVLPLIAVFLQIDISHWMNIARAAFRLAEFLNMSRILRITRDVEAIWAVRITLYRSAETLILPIFFFALFNVSAGVILYFVEPCFDYTTCPWHDLFEATYFSVVSMTTTGYGDQKPTYNLGRSFTVVIMFFGALFVSMPLAIIGNEWEAAWAIVSEKTALEKKQNLDEARKKEAMIRAYRATLDKEQEEEQARANLQILNQQREQLRSIPKADVVLPSKFKGSGKPNYSGLDAPQSEQAVPARSTAGAVAVSGSALLSAYEGLGKSSHELREQCADMHESIVAMHPGVLICLTQTRDHLLVLIQQIENCLDRTQSNMKERAYGVMQLRARLLAERLEIQQDALAIQMAKAAAQTTQAVTGGGGGGQSLNRVSLTVRREAVAINFEAALAVPRRLGFLGSNTNDVQGIEALFDPTASKEINWDPSRVQRSSWVRTTLHDDSIYHANRTLLSESDRLHLERESSAAKEKRMLKAKRKLQKRKEMQAKEELDEDLRDTSIFGLSPLITPVVSFARSWLSYYGIISSSVAPDADAASSSHDQDFVAGDKIIPSRGEVGEDGHHRHRHHHHDDDDDDDEDIKDEEDEAFFDTDIHKQNKPKKPKKHKKKKKKAEKAVLPFHEQVLADRLKEVADNPDSIANRIWLALEVPTSSREARYLQLLLLFCIILSILVLYTETLTTYSSYGEDTKYCRDILELYCVDKTSQTDPGCFVQNAGGTASDVPLAFGCDANTCYGKGHNFGSGVGKTNMTCHPSSNLQAFQTSEQLQVRYGIPSSFDTKAKQQRRWNICHRVECRLDSKAEINGAYYWSYCELFSNIFFSVELLLRVLSSGSVRNYFADLMNFIDVFVLIPYYVDVGKSISEGVSFTEIDFSILPSAAEPNLLVMLRTLKVLRLFKLSRHFRASRVLLETGAKAWKQVLGIMALLVFLVLLFANVLFEAESGIPCYVGDQGCKLKPADLDYFDIGSRVVINKNGDISQMPDVLNSLWFSFVTITTVGFGDKYPQTNAGQVMAILLMLSGAMYMSIPLTVVGKVYYDTHSKYLNESELTEVHQRREIADRMAAATAANDASLAEQQANMAGIAAGVSLAAMDAINSKATYELDFADALRVKFFQKKLIQLRLDFHKLTGDLLVPLKTHLSSLASGGQGQGQGQEADETIISRVRRLSKETVAIVKHSKDVLAKLADVNYRREMQLASMVAD